MAKLIKRLIMIGDAISQLCNVAFFPNIDNTTANESISGRSYRCGWKKTQWVIDTIFSPFEKNHCRVAYENDIARAVELLESAQKRNK